MFEECLKGQGIELLEAKRRRCATQTCRSKPQQQAEGVAVAGHGVRARALLRQQALGEELLQQGRKCRGAHRAPPVSCRALRRSVASVSTSGTAPMYQEVKPTPVWP